MRRPVNRSTVAILGLGVLLAAGVASAQQAPLPNGFQLNRYEPTMPGAWFLAVEDPWYSSTRWFAGGLTLNYGHNPLVFGYRSADGSTFDKKENVVEHQLVGHIDLATSFDDRLTINATLPLTLLERGTPSGGAAPLDGKDGRDSFAVGDPRVSVYVRLWNQPDKDSISIHLGGSLWFPIGQEAKHSGDHSFRGMPKIILSGLVRDHWRWSLNLGYLFRYAATIGQVPPEGSTIGQELQLGLAVQYTDIEKRWAIGPELLVSTVTDDPGRLNKSTFFNRDFTSMEILASGHVHIAKEVMLSLGAGIGVLRDPGTPDVRALARLVWAPVRCTDRDGDGICDDRDACPDVKGDKNPDPKWNGCPVDRDHDEILDADDVCPDVHKGEYPDPSRKGCPADRDGDGVLDQDDRCIDVPQGKVPDPARAGCPLDTDGDTFIDEIDQCPTQKPGLMPDPDRVGCPAPDRDDDKIPDKVDACPDKPGAPDPDPKKNGCPGEVQVKNCEIETKSPVFFATDKDVILPKSFKLLQSMANALKLAPSIKRVSIEGHTDIMGSRAHNLDLSERRAKRRLRCRRATRSTRRSIVSMERWLIWDRSVRATALLSCSRGSPKVRATSRPCSSIFCLRVLRSKARLVRKTAVTARNTTAQRATGRSRGSVRSATPMSAKRVTIATWRQRTCTAASATPTLRAR